MSEEDDDSVSSMRSFKRDREREPEPDKNSERGEVIPASRYDQDREDEDYDARDDTNKRSRARYKDTRPRRFFETQPALSIQRTHGSRHRHMTPIAHTKDGWFSLRCPGCKGYYCEFTDLAALDSSGGRTIIQHTSDSGQRVQSESNYHRGGSSPMIIEHYIKCNNHGCGIAFKMEFRQSDRNFMLTTKKVRL